MTDQTATPDDADPQVARQQRREPLLVLLSRMLRGLLLDAERPLLRAAVETELADGDDAHIRATQTGELLGVAEQAGNTAEAVRVGLVADNDRLRATLAAARDALAEAIMCGDGDCIAGSHMPKLERILGGVGLLGTTNPHPTEETP